MSEQLTAALQQAVAGLLYQSESDEPFEVFMWPDCPRPLRPEDVLSLAGHPPGTPVAQQTVEQFFASATQEQSWYGDEERATARRYRDLLALLRQHLPDAQVFRVGKVEVTVYIVGHAEEQCVGVKTMAVET
jgi:hypothetical protein